MEFASHILRNLETIIDIQSQPTSTFHTLTISAPSATTSSTAQTHAVLRSGEYSTTMITTFTTSYVGSTTISTIPFHVVTSTPTSTGTASASPTTTNLSTTLSPSAAMGIGAAAGVIGTIIFVTAALFTYRCWKIRQSPTVRYYEQARLWKGFTPATPRAASTAFVESKRANAYCTELRSPATPSVALSPPLDERRRSWPAIPNTPQGPLMETPV